MGMRVNEAGAVEIEVEAGSLGKMAQDMARIAGANRPESPAIYMEIDRPRNDAETLALLNASVASLVLWVKQQRRGYGRVRLLAVLDDGEVAFTVAEQTKGGALDA
jgi:hypothetical protein